MKSPKRFYDGCRILVIGGGPAGCFFALHLLRLTSRYDRRVEITIIDSHDYLDGAGPESCKGCAGVASSRLNVGLSKLGITIPDEVTQEEITSYDILFGDRSISIEDSFGKGRVCSVYRGRGPINNPFSRPKSFDQFLRETVKSRGANVVSDMVSSISVSDREVTVTGSKQMYVGDFVVVAAGLSSNSIDFPNAYSPPSTVKMILSEIMRATETKNGNIRAYYSTNSNVIFGAAVPKDKFVSVAVLPSGEIKPSIMHDFITNELCASQPRCVHSSKSKCVCQSKIAISSAGNYFGDRFAYVGDAAVTKLFKDGMGSAFFLSKSLASSVFYNGFSKWGRYFIYYPQCILVSVDNIIGKVLFKVISLALSHKTVQEELLKAVSIEGTKDSSKRPYSFFLWSIATGGESYASLLLGLIRPKSVAIIWAIIYRKILKMVGKK